MELIANMFNSTDVLSCHSSYWCGQTDHQAKQNELNLRQWIKTSLNPWKQAHPQILSNVFRILVFFTFSRSTWYLPESILIMKRSILRFCRIYTFSPPPHDYERVVFGLLLVGMDEDLTTTWMFGRFYSHSVSKSLSTLWGFPESLNIPAPKLGALQMDTKTENGSILGDHITK